MSNEIPEPGPYSMVWAMLLTLTVVAALVAFWLLMFYLWGFGR